MNKRVIARLDIKNSTLIKGIRFEGLRVIGDPVIAAQSYYETGADELLYIDAVASLYGRNSLADFVEKTAKNIFIPITVGGGLRTVDDVRNILRSGADKVAINTGIVKNPGLISEIVNSFGRQCLVAQIDAKKTGPGNWEVYIEGGRERTKIKVTDWAKEVVQLGAGEILLTSVDQDGTKAGFDIEISSLVSNLVDVPVIACGGFGQLKDAQSLFEKAPRISGMGLATSLHYGICTLPDVKSSLIQKQISVRV